MELTKYAKQIREPTQIAHADLPEPTQLEVMLDSFCDGVNNTAVNDCKEWLQLHSHNTMVNIH